MTPVYQTIFSSKNGNCMAAVWASLLDIPLEQVPNFVESADWFSSFIFFLSDFGIEYSQYLVNPNLRLADKELYNVYPERGLISGGIGRYFDANVFSPKYFDAYKYENDPTYTPIHHAVIVDANFNIVHDPNPMYKGIKAYPLSDRIGFNGVVGVSLYNKLTDKTTV